MALVNNVLSEFSAFSSHKVNAMETQVFFSSNIVNEVAKSLAQMLDF